MKNKVKQIAAVTAIVLIIAIYIVTLILAITNNENTSQWFMAAIIATIVLPVMAYVYIWIYKKVQEQREAAKNMKYLFPDMSDDNSTEDTNKARDQK